MGLIKRILIVMGLTFGLISQVRAETQLSNLALYYRCYSQITQRRPPSDDPNLSMVASGSKTYVNACMDVLAKGNFNSNHQLSNTMDPVARAVVTTMHNLHASWFLTRTIPDTANSIQNDATRDIYDTTSPAIYITRSLFDSSFPTRYILLTQYNLRPLRDNDNPSTAPSSGQPKSNFMFGSMTQFAGIGEGIIGVKVSTNSTWNYSYTTAGGAVRSGQIQPYFSLGGGVIGTTPYLLMNVEEDLTFVSDGAEKMPRKWARSLIRDFLGRELPVIRESDAQPYVVATSSVPFRKAATCVRCHATIDRMSSVIRHFGYQNYGSTTSTPSYGGYFPKFQPTDHSPETGWAAARDANYSKRPTRGILYFRNYKGELVIKTVMSVPELAREIVGTEDFYINLARRYYFYFTGIEVTIEDPAVRTVTSQERPHYDNVVNLGKALKTSQNISALIRGILSLDNYKYSNFRGVAGQ